MFSSYPLSRTTTLTAPATRSISLAPLIFRYGCICKPYATRHGSSSLQPSAAVETPHRAPHACQIDARYPSAARLDAMAICKFEGNSDMYGLGIRLGFYLQWYGANLARWIAPSEVKSLAFSLDLFVAATFLALTIQTANGIGRLQPVETYIVLLLIFGAYLALVPIYIWRLLTRCDPYWDPTRYPLVNLGAFSANLNFLLLIGVLIFQFWFWFDRVPDLDHYTCQQYGFLLSQVRLNSKVSVVMNALMFFWLGMVCLYLLVLKIRHMYRLPDPAWQRQRRVISRSYKERHIAFLQHLDNCIRFVVAVVVTVAAEFTISWNEIKGASILIGAGNTIPFFIGLGAVVRILYVATFYGDEDSNDGDSYHSYEDMPRPPGPPDPLPVRQLPEMLYRPYPIPIRQMPVMDQRQGR